MRACVREREFPLSVQNNLLCVCVCQKSGASRDAGGVSGLCFSPEKELRLRSKQMPRGVIK